MREGDDFQLSSSVTASCTEIDEGGRRNTFGVNIKISVLDMFEVYVIY